MSKKKKSDKKIVTTLTLITLILTLIDKILDLIERLVR